MTERSRPFDRLRARVTATLIGAMLILSPAAMSAAGDPGRADDAPAHTVYVATDGKAHAAGTLEDPFATVGQARDALAGRTSATEQGLVSIRGGEYPVASSIALEGAVHSYVTYAAYEGEKVEFTGATTLDPAKFQTVAGATGDNYSSASRLQASVSDKVLVYDLGAEDIPTGEIFKNGFNWVSQPFPPELVVDDAVQTIAQYPNGSETMEPEALSTALAQQGARDFFADKTEDTKTYEEMLAMPGPVFTAVSADVQARMSAWAPQTVPGETPENQPERPDIDNTAHETDGWLAGYFGNNYGNDRVRLYSINPSGDGADGETGHHVYTQTPTMYATTDKWLSLVASNVLSELDAPGEYYIDRWNGNDVLYYYPDGETVEGKSLTLTSLSEPFFTLTDVTGVTLEGITINGSTGNGIEMRDCESCVVQNSEILNVSMDAIKIGEATDTITAVQDYRTSRGGHNNRVVNNSMHDLGGGGVFLAGGDRKTLERGNNVVEHNEFYNISRLATYTPAVYLHGVGNTAQYNYIHDAPHMVIQIMGNNMLITHNRIENVVTNASDQGAIYSGRDFTYLGNEISYNLFKDVRGDNNQAIYMDDGMSAINIHHNVFENVEGWGVFFNSGHSSSMTDNVFLNTRGIGKDKLYHENGQELPIANSSVVADRFTDMLKAGNGENYTNTRAGVDAWYAHYEDQYPNIRDWYLPTAEHSASDIWENPNSLYVPSNVTLSHTVRIATGDFVYNDDADGLTLKTFNPELGAHDVDVADAADVAFDPESATFHHRTSLNSTPGFRAKWVHDWNKSFTLEGVGLLPDDHPGLQSGR